MSTTVTYKGATLTTATNQTRTLDTAGKYMEDDVTITDVTASATLQAKTNIAPTTSSQTITPDAGYDGLSSVQINAMPSGSVTAPSTISGTGSTITTGTNLLTFSKTISVTPTVSTAGYVSSGTAGNSDVSLSASVVTKAAATITPGTTNQTIGSGTYLTGTQTIAGSSNLVASNIKKNVTIFNVTGSYEGGGGVTPTGTIPISANGTYDVTNYASAAVNVSGGTYTEWEYLGGISNYELSYSGTSATTLTIQFSIATPTDSNALYFFAIRDQNGKRNGYFYGSDAFFSPRIPGSTSGSDIRRGICQAYMVKSTGEYNPAYNNEFSTFYTTSYGFFPYIISMVDNNHQFKARYNSNYTGTIDGTFDIKVYALSYPTGLAIPT